MLVNEVWRQMKQLNGTEDNAYFQRKETLGGTLTHDTLLSRRALYKLRATQLVGVSSKLTRIHM